MIHYLLLNNTGVIVQRGQCHSLAEVPAAPGLTSEVIDPSDTRQPVGPPPPTYADYRAMDYPPVGEQLDALWRIVQTHKLAAGDPAAQALLDRVQDVKTRFPKDRR